MSINTTMEVNGSMMDNQMEVDIEQQQIKNDDHNEVKDNDDDILMDDTKNDNESNKKTNISNVQVRRDSNGIIDFNYYKSLSPRSRKEQIPIIISSIPSNNPITEFLTANTYDERKQFLQDWLEEKKRTNIDIDFNINHHDHKYDDQHSNNNDNDTTDEEDEEDDDDDSDDDDSINDEYIANFISIQYIQFKFIDNKFVGPTWDALQNVGWKHIVEYRQYRIPEPYVTNATLLHLPIIYYANDVLQLLDIPSIPSLYGSVHTITTNTNDYSNTSTTDDQSSKFHLSESKEIESFNMSNEELRKQKIVNIIRQLRYEVIHSMVTSHFKKTTTTTTRTIPKCIDGDKKKKKRGPTFTTKKKKKNIITSSLETSTDNKENNNREDDNNELSSMSAHESKLNVQVNTSCSNNTVVESNDNNDDESENESENDNDSIDVDFKIEMNFNVNEIFDNDFSETLISDINKFIDNDVLKNNNSTTGTSTSTTCLSKVEEIEQHYIQYFNEWKMLLSTQHNILFYGIGSKRQLLDNFCFIELQKEGYILQLDGYDPTISISKILDLLVSLFLNNVEPKSLVSTSKNGTSSTKCRRRQNTNSNSPNNNNSTTTTNNKSMIYMNTFLYHNNNYHTFHPHVQRAIGISKDVSRIASTRTHLPLFLCIHNIETLVQNSIEEYKSNYGITIALQVIGVLSYCSLFTNTTKNITSTSSSIRLFATIDNIPLYQSLIRRTDTITYNTIHWINKHIPTCRPYNSKELQYCIKAVYENNIKYYNNCIINNNRNRTYNNNNNKNNKSTIELWSGSTKNDFKHFITVLRTLSPVRHEITKTLARLQLDAMNGNVSDDEDNNNNDKKTSRNKKKKTSSSFDEFGNHIASPYVDELTTWIDYKKLLKVCLEKWTIKTSIELRNLLGELIDQRIMFRKNIQVSSLSLSLSTTTTGYNTNNNYASNNNNNNNNNNNETSSTVEYYTIPKNATFLQQIMNWKLSV